MRKQIPARLVALWHALVPVRSVPYAPLRAGGLPQFLFVFLLGYALLGSSAVCGQDVLWGFTSQQGLHGGGTLYSVKSNGTGFFVRRAFAHWPLGTTAELCAGSDGNLYGATTNGGLSNDGTIFKVSPTGTSAVLHAFNAATDGYNPQGRLAAGNDGHFYGVNADGGDLKYGTIFRITREGSFSVLHHFAGAAGGANPRTALVKGNDGNFYGSTGNGGDGQRGVFFRITPGGAYTVLHHFTSLSYGVPADGAYLKGSDGHFYGISDNGGTHGNGIVFKITPAGKFTALHHLTAATDGSFGRGLTESSNGIFYGAMQHGGTHTGGTLFKITSLGGFTVLHHFNPATGGTHPQSRLTRGSDGNFYGTAVGSLYQRGLVYRLSPAGTFSVVHHLQEATDGAFSGRLTRARDGNLYGATNTGGKLGGGTLFRITAAGAFTVLRHLDANSDEGFPATYHSLTPGTDGHLYGLTHRGANEAVYRISTAGVYRTVYRLNGAKHTGYPQGTLLQGRDGAFYGMTNAGGEHGYGVIFKWCGGNYTVLHAFTFPNYGYIASGGLVQASDGNFYGITRGGGTYHGGTVFKLTPAGTFSILYSFDPAATGVYGDAGTLVQGNDGSLYGVAANTIFKVSLAGVFTKLHTLVLNTDGNHLRPVKLARGSDGNFYGLTFHGGANGAGTLYRITPDGTFTLLRALDFNADGALANGNLVNGNDGYFYGMTWLGGAGGQGTFFRISPAGDFKVLRTQGAAQYGALVPGTDGKLYGVDAAGGDYAGGTLFSLTRDGSSHTVLRHFNPATDGSTPLGSLLLQKPNPVAKGQSVSTPQNAAQTITLAGSGGTPLTYTITRLPQHGTLSGSGATRTYTPAANYAGSDSFAFTVTWGCQTSAPATVNISVTPASPAAVRINAGGPGATAGGLPFSADVFSTGATAVAANAVADFANTTSDVLYRDARRALNNGGTFGYAIPVANGTYLVKLHFAETYFGVAVPGGVGKRVFNVAAGGAAWLTNYDIFADAGTNAAVVKTKSVTVRDGTLTLTFTSVVEKAIVSAIEVIPAPAAGREGAGEAAAGESMRLEAYPNPATGLFTLRFTPAAPGPAVLEVYDATGRVVVRPFGEMVRAGVPYTVTVDARGWQKGLYVSRLVVGGHTRQAKVIVQR